MEDIHLLILLNTNDFWLTIIFNIGVLTPVIKQKRLDTYSDPNYIDLHSHEQSVQDDHHASDAETQV